MVYKAPVVPDDARKKSFDGGCSGGAIGAVKGVLAIADSASGWS